MKKLSFDASRLGYAEHFKGGVFPRKKIVDQNKAGPRPVALPHQ
jgi:hypothetical protein